MITHLHHLGWVVRSIDGAVENFASRQGLRLSGIDDHPGVRVAFLHTGPSMIELLEPQEARSDLARFLTERGEGLHHVAYAVPDIQVAIAEAARRGLKLLDSSPRPGARGTMIAFADPGGPDGTLVEYVQDPS